MKRFLVIVDGKIINERRDSRDLICEGEIEDDGTYGLVGQVFIDGAWIYDPVEIEEIEIANTKTMYLTAITESEKLGDQVEVDRLRQEWMCYKQTKCCKSYAEILMENDELIADSDKYLNIVMESGGVW